MAMSVDDIKDYLAENPGLRKGLVVTVGVAVLWFVVSSMFGTTKEETLAKIRPKGEQQSFLGVSDEFAKFDQAQAQDIVSEMRVRMDERERDMEAIRSKDQKELDALKEQQAKINAQLFELQNTLNNVIKNSAFSRNNEVVQGPSGESVGPQYQVQGDPRMYQSAGNGVMRRSQTEIVTESPLIEGNVIRTITQRSVREVEQSGKVSVRDIEVQRLTAETQQIDDQTAVAKARNREPNPRVGSNGEFTLTMGSIISGTLINGVAAPTKVGSQENPVPVLMRVKRDAIMPNYHTLDIKECFLLADAIGEMASERVLIRANGLSCITEDGQAIEKNLTAYAVSSADGMTGIRGTMIERSGKALANTMMAGFLSGFADAAAPQQINTLNTTPTATSAWQSQNLDRYAGAGMMKGASNAMERIASYYMAIAEAMWPVIELPAGVEVDFIVQKGMTLQLDPPARDDQGAQSE